ncbi:MULTISPECIES: hypothetical protein [Pseudoalteromonas]|uniref:hypothetical protein n=1 Tax=Pseudoalteromonas TaxID=53246 RepID=UPI0002CC2B8D|nr:MULTISPECIES: hypothetical protein [Pseudoalteromonas]ENN97593.1 hypothetical protein J139_16655 [Pseudoalteromonas agarivorans S816]TMS64258.1 hypothetical protein CWB83_18140 [Pseudoalteromonas sp. S1691]TMS65408.1 hypothetical protein CWB86_19520 [Pseudoalteromonas sp. S1731]TMS68763.1 hypothetical protein CWB88_19205 [Pseudoalteromonas sp. S1941]TMS75650.1 hypothetical protein CWB82_20495 [Pseudoalteromonas sp. S1690]
MLDDIFTNNEKRIKNLRKQYSANTLASMVNDRLKVKKIQETVTGADIDSFLKLSSLGKNRALISSSDYKDAMALDGFLA